MVSFYCPGESFAFGNTGNIDNVAGLEKADIDCLARFYGFTFTYAEPKKKPTKAAVEEAIAAEPKKKPAEAKTEAAPSKVEKKPSKTTAKKTTSTAATKAAAEEDTEKPAPKKRKKATTATETVAKVKETTTDITEATEPATEQEGESEDAAA